MKWRLNYGADMERYHNDLVTIEITVQADTLDGAMLQAERLIRETKLPEHSRWKLASGVIVIESANVECLTSNGFVTINSNKTFS